MVGVRLGKIPEKFGVPSQYIQLEMEVIMERSSGGGNCGFTFVLQDLRQLWLVKNYHKIFQEVNKIV